MSVPYESDTIADSRRLSKKPSTRFSIWVSERRLLLLLGDLCVVNLALFYSPLGVIHLSSGWTQSATWFCTLSAVWLVVAFLSQSYSLARSARFSQSLWSIAVTGLVVTVLYLMIPYITPPLPSRRFELFVFPLLAVSGLVLWRSVYVAVLSKPSFRQRILIIGAGWSGRTLVEEIMSGQTAADSLQNGSGYQIIGFVDDDPAKLGTVIADVPVMGNRRDLVGLINTYQPDEIVVAITHSQLLHAELFRIILECRELGYAVTTMTTIYERITGRVPVEHAGRDLYVVFPLDLSPFHRIYLALQRLMDLAAGIAGCLLVLAVSPFVLVANLFGSRGPLFYSQERVGRGGRPFQIVKFRSMIVDSETEGAVWAEENDPRITPIGNFLRKSRIDEFPQFWNILKGDMSLIGPRPERPVFVEKLDGEIPFYRARHAVKPGLTGWAQVNYRYGSSVNDALIKLQYDLYYVKHQGLYLDLLILLKTVKVVLRMAGR